MKIYLALLLTVLAFDQHAASYRILGAFPLPGRSHWTMVEQLMLELARRGHQVDVITHFMQKKPVPNYREISIEGTTPLATNRMTADDIKSFGASSIRNFTTVAGDKVCELLGLKQIQDIIKNPPKDPPYDLFVVELFAAPCFMAFARHLNVPLVGIVTAVMHDWHNHHIGNPLNPAYVPSLFSAFDSEMTFWDRLKNTVLTNVITFQIDFYTSYQREYVKKYFGMDVPVADFYQDLSLLLVNSHHSLHGVRPMTHAIVEVGGLHLAYKGDPLSPEVKKWLDESKDGCVFFTFGSMVRIETFPEHLVKELYKAFESIAPVRVLMKVAKKEDLLPGLPKNVMTQSWFPQTAVLQHKNTKAFITHGGIMGTTEAIYYGIPMIGIPLFGDQHVNIMNYVRKKVAVSLGSVNEVTAEKLVDALNTVLHDPVYRQNIKKLQELFKDRPTDALQTGVYWVEYVARHGNILQSPAIRLNWFQRNLIDVYGFILLCVLAVLGVLVVVLRTVKKMVCGGKTCPKKPESKKNK